MLQTAQITVTINNQLGLHARPAMSLVDAAAGFNSDIRLHRGEQTVDGKSIMQVMMLAAAQGTELRITAEGEDADQAIETLKDLIERNFDES